MKKRKATKKFSEHFAGDHLWVATAARTTTLPLTYRPLLVCSLNSAEIQIRIIENPSKSVEVAERKARQFAQRNGLSLRQGV